MKKKHMQRHIARLADHIRRLEEHETARRKQEANQFGLALGGVTPGTDALLVTREGHPIRATVTDVAVEYEPISTGIGFIQGPMSVSITLSARPGV